MELVPQPGIGFPVDRSEETGMTEVTVALRNSWWDSAGRLAVEQHLIEQQKRPE